MKKSCCFIKRLVKKYNERLMLKKGFVHCTNCNQLILQTNNYCPYCGKLMETNFF